MRRILNTRTNTLHKATGETGSLETPCGSLVHAPRAKPREVSDEDLQSLESVDHCGNCFDGAGGY